MSGMAGRYTGSYLERCNGWRAVAILGWHRLKLHSYGRIPGVIRYHFLTETTIASASMTGRASLLRRALILLFVPPEVWQG
jgi:hypothetical protein